MNSGYNFSPVIGDDVVVTNVKKSTQPKELTRARRESQSLETPSPPQEEGEGYFESREEDDANPESLNAISQSSSLPPIDGDDNEQQLTAQQRASREEEESLALARALMAEEAVASYSAHLDYLRHNQDQFSDEDFSALQAAMNDDENGVYTNNDGTEGEEEGEEEDIRLDSNGNMSYETMLDLGERLGDVKLERWRRVAQQKINALPTIEFNPASIDKKHANDCDIKCLICQEEYCTGEILRQLPCGHCFHHGCIDQWLLGKDFCPYCRTELERE